MHLKTFIQVTWFRGCWKEKILVFQIHLIICHQVELILVTWVISEEEFGERMFNQSIGDIYFDFYFKCGRYLESCECGWTCARLIGNDSVLLFRQPNFHSLCGQFLLGLQSLLVFFRMVTKIELFLPSYMLLKQIHFTLRAGP